MLLFALYLRSERALSLYRSPQFLWGIGPLLLFWISRMVMRTNSGGMHDDPIIVAVKDRVSQYCALIVLALALGGALK